jgi:hypothetical protein
MQEIISRSTMATRRCGQPVVESLPMRPAAQEEGAEESTLTALLVLVLTFSILLALSGTLRIVLHLALRSMI